MEHFEGLEVEQGLEAVTKDEAGTQGSACLAMNHTDDITLKLNFLLSDRTMYAQGARGLRGPSRLLVDIYSFMRMGLSLRKYEGGDDGLLWF